jgi:tetraacyldisaccharide 4'-kinase
VVTRKAAPQGEAAALAKQLGKRTREGIGIVAALEPMGVAPLRGGKVQPVASLKGRDVVAVVGIGEPELFAVPFERLGARVRLLSFGDHHAYTASEVAWIISTLPKGGVVLTTAKDAVKLLPLWPRGRAECLVVRLGVTITTGATALGELLDRVATAARTRKP